MTVEYWNGSTGFFRQARNWSEATAPSAGDELYAQSGSIILRGGSFGSADARTSIGLIGDTVDSEPTLTLRNVTLTNVSINNALPLYTGPFSDTPPGYYAAKYGAVQIVGTVTNDGGVIEAGRLGRGNGGSLTINLKGHATLVNTGSLEAVGGYQLNVSGNGGSTLENDGTINSVGGPIVISTHLTGVGTVEVLPGGIPYSSSVEINAAVDAGQTFEIQRGALQLDEPLSFLGQVQLVGNGVVVLEGLPAASWDAVDDKVEFFNAAGETIDTLQVTTPDEGATLAVFSKPASTGSAEVGVLVLHPGQGTNGFNFLPNNNPSA